MKTYRTLAIEAVDDLIFGKCPHPLRFKNGLTIGAGVVYPELNFTLPVMAIDETTMPAVREQYRQMIEGACVRASELQAPGLFVEFELLPDMTLTPQWGAEIVAILRETLDQFEQTRGLKSVLRVTPNDIREFKRPPLIRSGPMWEAMVRSFDLCAQAGADTLSIESTGGKEVHDDAIMFGDLAASVFALGVLGANDMASLWDMIVDVARRHEVIPAGDTACGFGNTAMMLAEMHHIPRVWAALVRVLTVPRSLVAFERGAVGPSKDCAYEGPYLKAITGCPIALEGAEAACAHFSTIGNIAKATADLWSNESVQNVRLLSGMAPTVSVEQLIYAVRLMNVAAQQGDDAALLLRNLFVESDVRYDPQAYVLRPDIVIQLCREIIAETTPYQRTRRAALAGLEALRKGHAEGVFSLSRAEVNWLSRLSAQADALPEDEEAFIAEMRAKADPAKILVDQYLN